MKNRILSFIMATVMLFTFIQPVFAQDIVNITDYDITAETAPTQTQGGYFFVDCTPEQAEAMIAFYEYAKGQIENQPMFMPFSAPGDSATATWSWGEYVGLEIPSGSPGNPYVINNIPSISLSTANPPIGRPFCAQFGIDPSGPYTASMGSNSQVLRLLVAYQKGSASAVGVQLALWYILSGIPINSHPQAAAALSAASGISTTGYSYLLWSGNGQPLVTLIEDDDPETPDPGDEPDENENPNTRTEVTTDTFTETVVQSYTNFEYSDAIGQVLVAKRDNEGNSLDGAVFRIDIEFANGQTGGTTAFEVYNGQRIYTYTHPANDHAPARVTVTELTPPFGYIADPTPKTAIIHPTYTRITKVMTHTITMTTTNTTTSIIDIDSGEVLAESTASSTAQTELNPPVVQEYTDFIEGDREVTLTFINTPRPCSLTIYKYSRGNYSQALAGARFRIRYADPSVSAMVWERTTNVNGMIIIDPLPYDGTLVIEELEASANHVIGHISSWTVTVAKGEQKRVDISNDPVSGLIAYKRDSVTGQLLGGAVIRATLLRSHTTPYESGIVYTATTEPNTGEARFTGLIPGEYRVEEISPPPFYLGTTTVHTVNIYDGSIEPVTVAFENDRYSGLTLIKLDAVTGARLPGAVFSLYRGTEVYPTAFIGDFQSNENGMVVIQNLESNQWYTAVEKQAPYGYELDPDHAVQTVFITPEALDQNLTIIFRNPPKPKLLIQKTDESGNPLPGAVFRLSKEDSADYIEITTGADGSVLVENLEETWYTAWEIRSPSGFLLDDTKHTVQLRSGRVTTLSVTNRAAPKLTVRKIDEQTLEGIEGVTLRITKQGAAEFMDVTTGQNGIITLPLDEGWFFVQERVAKPGYILDDTVHTIELKAGQDSEIVITNRKRPSLTIVKTCSVTKNPLQATFEIRVKNGRSLGTFTTDPETGRVIIEDLEFTSDTLILEISEARAPDGYYISTETMEVTIGWGESRVIEWVNTPQNPILIYKRDVQGNPIGDTEFLVTTVNGAHAATVRTDRTSGVAVVAGLAPGWYSVRETRTGGEEYILDSTPKLVELKYGSPAVVEFINDKRPQLQIRKLNSADHSPMPGVLVRVVHMNGQHIGDYRTNSAGLITIMADPGWVTVYELETLKGFVLDPKPVNVELKVNGVATVELFNDPLPGLQLRKTCGVSGKPLAGVQYQITRLNGSVIGTFETDAQGIIYLETDETHVVITELKTVDSYKLDSVPRTVELAPGELTVVSFKNMPFPVLEIVKLDSQSKEPLAGVKYKVFDNAMRELGTFTTNALGRIVLTGMAEGRYFVQEHDVSAAGPYILDRTVHEVDLYYGKTTRIELLNTKMGSLRLLKVCAETGQPLPGATFLLYDDKNNILGEYTTNAHGMIELGERLEPQTIRLKEIKSPAGWVLDSTLHEVTIKAGESTEITLANEPERGTIQIIKKAAADNDITKDKAGAALAGAVFEIVNEKLEIVDTITTDSRGMATSKPLPIGRYAIQETQSPKFYVLDGSVFYAEIRLPGDVVRFEVLNTPADIAVTIEKRGPVEAKTGEVIRYDFANISNAGNTPLDNFYFHDKLPDEVQLETFTTGTWSHRHSYRVEYRTNLKTDYRVWRNNLLTTANHELSVSGLRLAEGEYVTDVVMIFGTVEPGFREKDAPYITARVLDTLEHEARIINRAAAGGKANGEWSYDTDSWVTITQAQPKKPLPKTGLN